MTALCEGHDLGRRSVLDGESVMSVSGSLYALCSNVRVVTKSSSVYVCEKRIKQFSFLYICVRHAFQVADSDPRLHLRLRIVEEHLNGVPFRFHYDPLLDPLYPTDCLFFCVCIRLTLHCAQICYIFVHPWSMAVAVRKCYCSGCRHFAMLPL